LATVVINTISSSRRQAKVLVPTILVRTAYNRVEWFEITLAIVVVNAVLSLRNENGGKDGQSGTRKIHLDWNCDRRRYQEEG
jgi:hypothetical protein